MTEEQERPQAEAESEAEQPEPEQPREPEQPPPPEPPREPEETQEPERIWDPVERRWMGAHEIASAPPVSSAPSAPQPVFAARPPSAAQAPLPAGAVPHWMSALVAGVVGAVLAVVAMLFVPGVVNRDPRAARAPQAIDRGADQSSSSNAEIVARARPWVVGIAVSGSLPTAFGTRPFTRTGSGVVVREDGAIATPARLVDGADDIQVTLSTGTAVKGTVVGSDAQSDIAVVQVEQRDLEPAVQGTSEALELGDAVIAVSVPTGLSTVVTTGAISAIGRVAAAEGVTLFDLLQVDAPLATGGSGGVVVGASNAAIGMTASFGDTTGTIGYAIPIDIVRSVSEQLLDGRKPAHPWIGLTVEAIDADSGPALVVSAVFTGSPAAAAGIKAGEHVIGIDGGVPQGPLTLLKKVLDHKVGDEITLTISRGDASEDVKVKIQERPAGG